MLHSPEHVLEHSCGHSTECAPKSPPSLSWLTLFLLFCSLRQICPALPPPQPCLIPPPGESSKTSKKFNQKATPFWFTFFAALSRAYSVAFSGAFFWVFSRPLFKACSRVFLFFLQSILFSPREFLSILPNLLAKKFPSILAVPEVPSRGWWGVAWVWVWARQGLSPLHCSWYQYNAQAPIGCVSRALGRLRYGR